MDGLIVAESVITGQAHGASIRPHPNLAFSTGFAATLQLCPISALKEPLDEKIFLLQVMHAMHHLHSEGYSCQRPITKEDLFVSKCGRKVVLLVRKCQEKDEAADISAFRDSFMPTNPNVGTIAANLFQCMRNATSKGVLQHPYFWDTLKRLTFLAKVVEYTKSNEGRSLRDQINFFHGLQDPVFDLQNGWSKQLELTLQEVEILRDILSDKNLPLTTTASTISSLALFYQPSLIFLMYFMTDMWEKFWEKNNDVKVCFSFDPFEGFWNFFNNTYPNLFLFLYDKVKSEDILEIQEVFLEPATLNRELPAGELNEENMMEY